MDSPRPGEGPDSGRRPVGSCERAAGAVDVLPWRAGPCALRPHLVERQLAADHRIWQVVEHRAVDVCGRSARPGAFAIGQQEGRVARVATADPGADRLSKSLAAAGLLNAAAPTRR